MLRRAMLARTFAATLVALMLLSGAAHAFSVDVHRRLAERALKGVIDPGGMPVVQEKAIVAFWMWLGRFLAQQTEPALDQGHPQRFVHRYPSPYAFDAFAVRGFLGLRQTGDEPVWGIDTYDRSATLDRLATLVGATALPDLDRRNQDRFAYDTQRRLITLPDGRPVPADPASLNMGALTGLSSQAHAHYQLVAVTMSRDPEVLKARPWAFAVPFGWPEGPVATSAAHMAQLHLDLAVLAKAWGEVEYQTAGDYLALTWLGAGLHYVQDVAGPLHAVQVGSYELFKQAQIAHWLMAARTGGGTWGELCSFSSIGVDFLRNHHLTAEAWLARELSELEAGRHAHPAVTAAWQAAGQDDSELGKALGTTLDPYLTGPVRMQPWDDGEGAASLLVKALAELASREGGALYDAMALAGGATLTQVGTRLPDDTTLRPTLLGDPTDPQVQQAIERMAQLHASSMRRAFTATRLYWQAFTQANSDAAIRRLRRNALLALEAAERRRAQYQANPPPAALATVHDPRWLWGEIAALIVVAGAGLGVRWLWRRRKRRSAEATV
jgi:hypothetical protein